MSNFANYLRQHYGLKDGEEIPDDIYEKASSEFLKAQSTISSIAPTAASWSLDKAVSDQTQKQAPVALQQPNATSEAADDTFGGLIPDAKFNVLSAYFSANKDFRDLVQNTGLKDREKTTVVNEWQRAEKEEWEPVLNKIGMSLPEAKFAIESAEKKAGQTDSLSEALGLSAPKAKTGAIPKDDIEEVKQLQSVRGGLVTALDSAPSEEEKRNLEIQIANLDGRIETKLGMTKKPLLDMKAAIDQAKLQLEEAKKMEGGAVNYLGIDFGAQDFETLGKNLELDEKNLFLRAKTNPSELRVSLANASKTNDGRPVSSDVASRKMAELRKTLQPGEWYQDETGEVKVYGGPNDSKERDYLPDYAKGASAIGGKIIDTVLQNPGLVEQAVDITTRGAVTSAKQTAKAVNYLPSVVLARKGIEYLSEIGRKAEADKKQRK